MNVNVKGNVHLNDARARYASESSHPPTTTSTVDLYGAVLFLERVDLGWDACAASILLRVQGFVLGGRAPHAWCSSGAKGWCQDLMRAQRKLRGAGVLVASTHLMRRAREAAAPAVCSAVGELTSHFFMQLPPSPSSSSDPPPGASSSSSHYYYHRFAALPSPFLPSPSPYLTSSFFSPNAYIISPAPLATPLTLLPASLPASRPVSSVLLQRIILSLTPPLLRPRATKAWFSGRADGACVRGDEGRVLAPGFNLYAAKAAFGIPEGMSAFS
ncbi:hypothetical protein C8F04DRAFT_1403292 [Mycena alexandri]|uniref:Uncharacterized protein n=1 Tax=Mycena alexandri TaxID=1745969 RepID=A0AAD6S4Y9_9AGAR|nr:hypothetical protein C8F04DRAFT_1403292 [Mycena alexandri]